MIPPLFDPSAQLTGTVPPGCGANLPITVVVGGVESDVAATSALFSYRQATFTSVGVSPSTPFFALRTLPPMGSGGMLTVKGANFGPYRVTPTPMTLRDYSRQYTFATSCTQRNDASSDSELECAVPPGAGASLIFAADICGQPAVERQFGVSYAPPLITSLAGPGANRASTAGGQVLIINGVNFGPVALVPSAIKAVYWSRGWTGLPFWMSASACSVTVDNVQVTCLTGAGTGANLILVCLNVQRARYARGSRARLASN